MRELGETAWATDPYSIPERWGAFANDQGVGLTVFVPSAYPYALGYRTTAPGAYGTNYFYPQAHFGIGPGTVIEADIYLIAGDVAAARQAVYALHGTRPVRDISSPLTVLHLRPGTVSGVVEVAGTAFDNVAVARVEVLVDGRPAGTARYGLPAPSLAGEYPDHQADAGFAYSLDTRAYPNGRHTVAVRATDRAGLATVRRAEVTVAN
jgi:hypothetical protein